MENIAYGLNPEEINEQKVWDSIEAAQISDLVKSMPRKLLTKVGENGIRLSGGQRQRIAIARAFYRNSKILILDEATSALDNKTEADVISALNNLQRDLTIIFIAHRISTVKSCDCIYEFEDGQLKAYGTYEELIENSKTFQDMINTKNNSFKF